MRKQISYKRFKWKLVPWMRHENILALWIYCSKGILSFEFEINPKIPIPKMTDLHARNSKNTHLPNFIKINDPQIVSNIGNNIKNFDVKGAIGKGILIGDISIDSQKEIPVMSTLHDWYDLSKQNSIL